MKDHDAIGAYSDRFMTGGGKLRHISHYSKIVTTQGEVFEVGEEPEHYPAEVKHIQQRKDTDIRGKTTGEPVYLVSFDSVDEEPVEIMSVSHGQLRPSPVQKEKENKAISSDEPEDEEEDFRYSKSALGDKWYKVTEWTEVGEPEEGQQKIIAEEKEPIDRSEVPENLIEQIERENE